MIIHERGLIYGSTITPKKQKKETKKTHKYCKIIN